MASGIPSPAAGTARPVSQPGKSSQWSRPVKRPVPALSPEWLSESCRFVAEVWRRFDDHPDPAEPVSRPGADEILRAPETTLRRYRQFQSVHILWQDLAGRNDIASTGRAISSLARDCLELALIAAEHRVAQTCGQLLNEQGQPIRLAIFGLGKLGGDELNFNSDIDIVFAHDGEGRSSGPRQLDAARYLQQVARELIRLLDTVTEHGRVWIVDARLRPFGDSGALVWSTRAMEQYFLTEGRTWERYAWLKATPVAGDIAAGQRLLDDLRPFIFRRYLDYGIFDSLRDLHARIEANTRNGTADIKRGPGGIRAAEFLVQSQQILRGGREQLLRTPGFLPALEACTALGLIPAEQAQALHEAYSYLRIVENRLQAQSGRQGHHLPTSAEDREGLARLVGHEDSTAFEQELSRHQAHISSQFRERFREPVAPAQDDHDLWPPQEECAQALSEAGYAEAESGADALVRLDERLTRRGLSAEGHRRLERLMPTLLRKTGEQERADELLPELLQLVEQISRRSAYLSLLHERPQTLDRLIRVFALSEKISRWIIASPQLLDDLLDPIHGLDLPALPGLDPNEPEEALNALGRWRQAGFLRTALAELDERISAVQAAERLSLIAETILGEILNLIGAGQADLAVIAYGNLGARALHYQSDLDLVFLHAGDSPPVRIAQRLISLMQMPLQGGRLFEIDTRLRPNGRAGLLVSRLESFAEYQLEQAWTWEHQALIRARWVAGDAASRDCFEAIRRQVLCRERDTGQVRQALAEMRDRQRRERSEDEVKGVLTDVQYIAEAGILSEAGAHPDLVELRSPDQQLEALGRLQWIDPDQAEQLARTWQLLTGERHIRWLGRNPDSGSIEMARPVVERAWFLVFGEST
ncbi:MAG: bifunctional [glutamate--ammonia ligase]-adenylyl-L-tyrosine phosphorylase/[glutamate--ammonia-ligase] adenylyltransferase [Wenzhouxiangella sp.]|nr:MAG: bifunctional [glutamate--ammonia ligase]-adenylyl-L-tyrosine phosphorylase/[glutamate--ammonia-ligase] adenylyltransferase [Wenzhouxiangella sp.]